MNKEQFLALMREIKDISPELLPKYFKGYDFDFLKYYVDELQKAYKGEQTIFKGTVKKLPDSWGIVENLTACFVMKYDLWEEVKQLVFDKEIKTSDDNPYPRIFVDKFAFDMFEMLIKDIKERTQLADVSFIFRQMQKDELIYEYVGDSEFRNWLSDEYSIDIDLKLKTLDRCTTTGKVSNYSNAKLSLKQNSTTK